MPVSYDSYEIATPVEGCSGDCGTEAGAIIHEESSSDTLMEAPEADTEA